MIDNQFYLQLSKSIFESYYGPLEDMIIAAILPSYQEQGNSSLIAMADYFITSSKDKNSGYYLDEPAPLDHLVAYANRLNKKILLIGVTYALLKLASAGLTIGDPHIVMETGGMKGRGKELIREELHQKLKNGLHVSNIHSEYGMTELTSQAYSQGDGIFRTPNSMEVKIRDINDPFRYVKPGKSGGANIIDLGNFASCSFIETKDIVRQKAGEFEVLGRFDNSDLRGCNLLLV